MDRELLEKACGEALGNYLEILPIEWCPRSILLSEGLAICAAADLMNLDLIIESGVYSGRSTEIWARYKSPKRSVIAIDLEIRGEAQDRLAKYQHVTLLEGDAQRILPSMLENYASNRIGLVIDGPKELAAVRLAELCIKQPQVKFVAVHDMHLNKPEARKKFDEIGASFFTDAEWFVSKYSHLDDSESNWDNEQGVRWRPYECEVLPGMPRWILGSYGPTVGFIFANEDNPRKCR